MGDVVDVSEVCVASNVIASTLKIKAAFTSETPISYKVTQCSYP
jgi:hypothetical protein